MFVMTTGEQFCSKAACLNSKTTIASVTYQREPAARERKMLLSARHCVN